MSSDEPPKVAENSMTYLRVTDDSVGQFPDTVSPLGSPKSPRSSKRGPRPSPSRKDRYPLYGQDGEETRRLLRDLRPISDSWLTTADTAVAPLDDKVKEKLSDLQIAQAMSCASCSITFESREEQRNHFKTDWHRFNVKQRVKGAATVTESAFLDLADNISSLSGTDYTDSEGEEAIDQAVKTLPAHSKSYHYVSDEDDEPVLGTRQTKLYLKAKTGQILSIYRNVVCPKKMQHESTDELLRQVEQVALSSHWVIIMMGGGHFAAAVYKDGEVIAHKTFHRYVVRQKAGTAQSQYDKQGGHAKSAGAQIRRHNEQALAQDITNLLTEWAVYIDSCHRIFLRVATNNYNYIFSKKEKSHLNKGDSRIRMVPFPTRRATFSEVQRVYTELSSVQIFDAAVKIPGMKEKKAKPRKDSQDRRKRQTDPVPEICLDSSDDESEIELVTEVVLTDTADLEEFDETRNKSSKRRERRKKKQAETPPPTVTHLPVMSYQSELYTSCHLGEAAILQEMLITHGEVISAGQDSLSAAISQPIDKAGHTLLHIACRAGHCDVVTVLLEMGCDPAKEDLTGTVPYLCTQNKNVRHAFRRFMADHPEKYNYNAAQVPGPLTAEMEAEKQAKDAERKRQLRKKKNERLKSKKEEQAKERAEEEERKRFLALSDREKRALAAEKRLLDRTKGTGAQPAVLSRCYQCATDITGKVPFEYNNFTFCTPACLKKHRLSTKMTS